MAEFIMYPTPDRKALRGPSVKGRLPLEPRAQEGKLRCLCDLLILQTNGFAGEKHLIKSR